MIYFIVTTCIFTKLHINASHLNQLILSNRNNTQEILNERLRKENSIREIQYRKGILTLYNQIQKYQIEDYRIIIVENNGFRSTYLDELSREIGATVYYTFNNQLATNNRGYKELQDVLDVISLLPISDDDFVVKMTGRYLLDDTCSFLEKCKNIDENTDAIIHYGSFMNPSHGNIDDCITGLIGMRCSYIKQIEKPQEDECVEWKWAKASQEIPECRVVKLKHLGIWICPGSNDFFLV